MFKPIVLGQHYKTQENLVQLYGLQIFINESRVDRKMKYNNIGN